MLLSVMMLCGTPKRKMIDLMKFMAIRAVELVIGTASIHFVNLSTATNDASKEVIALSLR